MVRAAVSRRSASGLQGPLPRSLLTGGAGFIGSHLVEALLERGDEVLVVDDLSTGRRENVADHVEAGAIVLAEADIADAGALAAAVDDFSPERILHIAGQADARKAIADPNHDARVNVIGTVNVLEVARRHGASVVFTSTGGVSYGEGEGRRLPFRESDETRPETAYGVSKLAAEKYVSFYRLLHGVPAVSLRLGHPATSPPHQVVDHHPHRHSRLLVVSLLLTRAPGPSGPGSSVRPPPPVCLAHRQALPRTDPNHPTSPTQLVAWWGRVVGIGPATAKRGANAINVLSLPTILCADK